MTSEELRLIEGMGAAPPAILEGGHQDGFALYQNRPNPFRDQTAIGFYLPKATPATLTIYDVAGKVVHAVKGNYSRGYHQVYLQHLELDMVGVLFYQLDTKDFIATRRMILVE